jgi:hypothetical protein
VRASPVAELAEPDVRIDGERHEEDEGGIKQDKARLSNVTVILSGRLVGPEGLDAGTDRRALGKQRRQR